MTGGETTTLVILGASGDLTHRKLIPSLCNLYCKGRLPQDFRVVGVSRSPLSDQQFMESLLAGVHDTVGMHPSPDQWQDFSSRIYYVAGDVTTAQGIKALTDKLSELDGASPGKNHRLYYLALAPSLYEPAVGALGESGLAADAREWGEAGGWRRVVIEKPFGVDLTSAKKLNRAVHSVFNETQVYRIDHYLGKETVQNLLVFRFANAIFEPLWNRNYIDHVQLTVAETVSVSERGDYYDQAGLLRDMFQNHLLQLLTLVAMEPPSSFNADALRDEKVKVLKALRRVTPREVGQYAVAGQYQGYCDEPGVAADSLTPTYAALRLNIDNWRWQDVPFYLRSGKALAEKTTEIVIQFRRPPHMMFPMEPDQDIPANTLAICVQPDEGFHLRFQAKTPDVSFQLEPVDLEFHYESAFGGQAIPDAYERLLLDALNGDASLFARSDEIEQAWTIMDPFIQGLSSTDGNGVPPAEYPQGSWGPQAAEDFIKRDGRQWLLGCGGH